MNKFIVLFVIFAGIFISRYLFGDNLILNFIVPANYTMWEPGLAESAFSALDNSYNSHPAYDIDTGLDLGLSFKPLSFGWGYLYAGIMSGFNFFYEYEDASTVYTSEKGYNYFVYKIPMELDAGFNVFNLLTLESDDGVYYSYYQFYQTMPTGTPSPGDYIYSANDSLWGVIFSGRLLCRIWNTGNNINPQLYVDGGVILYPFTTIILPTIGAGFQLSIGLPYEEYANQAPVVNEQPAPVVKAAAEAVPHSALTALPSANLISGTNNSITFTFNGTNLQSFSTFYLISPNSRIIISSSLSAAKTTLQFNVDKNDPDRPADGDYSYYVNTVYKDGTYLNSMTDTVSVKLNNPNPAVTLDPSIFIPDSFEDQSNLTIGFSFTNSYPIASWDMEIYKDLIGIIAGESFTGFTGSNDTFSTNWDGSNSIGSELVESAHDYPVVITATDIYGNTFSNFITNITTGLLIETTSYGCRIRVSTIQFDKGKTSLNPEYYPLLDQISSLMKKIMKNPGKFGFTSKVKKIAIICRTDDLGDSDLNITLTTKRAQAVAGYLVKDGIPSSLLIIKGYGSVPITLTNGMINYDVSEARKHNHMIEIRMSK